METLVCPCCLSPLAVPDLILPGSSFRCRRCRSAVVVAADARGQRCLSPAKEARLATAPLPEPRRRLLIEAMAHADEAARPELVDTAPLIDPLPLEASAPAR